MKKISFAVFICLLFVFCFPFLFNGCKTKAPKAKIDAQGNKIISLYTMQLKPQFTDFINGILSDFEKQNPKVKVQWIDQPAAGFETKLMSMYSVGESPDVINSNTNMMLNLVGKNLLLNLNDHITTDEKSAFIPTILNEACTFKGKLVGIPWYISPAVTIINTDIFRKAKLDPNMEIKTWDQMFDVCRQIKENTGYFGQMIPLAEDGSFKIMLLNEGVPIVNDARNKAVFNTPAGVAVLKRYKEAYDKEWIPRECITGNHRRAIDMFKNGKTAMLINGPQFLKIIKQEAPDIYANCTITYTPARLPDMTYGADTQTISISSKTPYPKESLALALCLCSPKNQLAFAKQVPVFPSTIEALNDPFFNDPGNTPEQKAIYIGAKEVAKAVPSSVSLPYSGKLSRAIDDMMREVILRNVQPEKAMQKAAERWDRILNTPKVGGK